MSITLEPVPIRTGKIIDQMTDEEIAVFTYAMESFDLEELQESPKMKMTYDAINTTFKIEYKKRGIDYEQFFDKVKLCPECGAELHD